jgi:hypothetical protein
MRGKDEQQLDVFSYVSPEQRVPRDRPLRPLRVMTDEALKELQPWFNKLYAKTGRPSNRAVVEGSASWDFQGGMVLHLRGRSPQLSPHEESGDSSNVNRGLSRPESESARHQRMRLEHFPNHKITETGRHLARRKDATLL